MSDSRLGLVEINCDAPPYAIVWACEDVGFRTPLDVRWCRLSTFPRERNDWWRQLWREPWRVFRARTQTGQPRCSCGHALPPLDLVEFTYVYGKEARYLLGQCPRCRTIFWEDPASCR